MHILGKKNGKPFTQSEKIKEVKANKLKDKEMQKRRKEINKIDSKQPHNREDKEKWLFERPNRTDNLRGDKLKRKRK